MKRVTRTVRAILRRCDGDHDVVSKNISLFLILTTDLDWPPGVAQIDDLASCVGLVDSMTTSVFIQIIRNLVHQKQTLKEAISQKKC